MPYPIELEFVVEPYLKGVRIDTFLSRQLRNYNPWRITRMVESGLVHLEDELAPLIQRVRPGDRVRVKLVEPPDKLYDPIPLPLDIVFEDPWMLIINKGDNIIVHPTGDFQGISLCHAVQHHLDQQTLAAGLLRPGIVHRLDRRTSGLIAVAKDHLSHRELSISFQESRVQKTYLAIVEGEMKKSHGVIDLPIGRARRDSRVLMSARADAIDRRPAKTIYHVIQRGKGHTLVAASLITGRNHQIRVHMAAIGHPLVDDGFYDRFGKIKPDAYYKQEDPRQALHAWRLGLAHPITAAWMEFRSPLPADLIAIWRRVSAETPAI